ncbi:hypothetical protein V1478_001823 [Vespula squamosa]|uniref:Uncharacterized protein n=1 Tax=Vespula squamosa TaxID=30214 RepID=A0ABD2BY77_VESSQ
MVWSKDTLLFGPKRCYFLEEMLEKGTENKRVGWDGEGLELKEAHVVINQNILGGSLGEKIGDRELGLEHKGTRNNAGRSLMESSGIEFHAAENMTTHRRATLFNGATGLKSTGRLIMVVDNEKEYEICYLDEKYRDRKVEYVFR